jgi:S-adenosylmethionine synthetase
MLDPLRDLRFIFEVRSGVHSTTGGIFGDEQANVSPIHYRFHPRSLDDLPETRKAESSDTSLGCAWAPYSTLEQTVLCVEWELNSRCTKADWPWLGSDIKIMARRCDREVSMVVAAPILASWTPTVANYFERVQMVRSRVAEIVCETAPKYDLKELVINSGDDIVSRKLYMNFTGSSIESGDEGVVGRGNRMGGIISPMRPYTMEGIAGKNPRYNVGKVYSAAAYKIACRIYQDTREGTNIFLANRMGQPLSEPWCVVVEACDRSALSQEYIRSIVEDVMFRLSEVTNGLLNSEFPIF